MVDRSKVKKTLEVLQEAFNRFDRIGLAWSGGKDSTVLLYLTRKFKPNIPVIFNDTTQLFPETYEYRDRLAKEWNLNLIVAKPEIPEGFPIAKAREKCCHLLKTQTTMKTLRKLNLEAIIVGIRWDEHVERSKEKYISKRKFHFRVHPILHWTVDDVFNFLKANGIPTNPLYEKGFKSIGCKPCTVPTPAGGAERSGRSQDKERIMARLRALGYW